MLEPVSELKFAQPERRNFLAPVLVAVVILGIAITLLLLYTPRSTAQLTILKTIIYPTHTVFKSESILVGRDRSQDDLYILTTIRVEDRLNLPLFIKDLTGTLVTAEGETIETSAVQKQDLENLYTSFPVLRPLASTPLLRDTRIDPRKTAEGMVILHFPVTKDVWNHRKSGKLNLDFYHQRRISIVLPQGIPATAKDNETKAP